MAGAAIAGTGTGAGLNHFSLEDWATIASISVSCATLIFVIAQFAYLIWKWQRQRQEIK